MKQTEELFKNGKVTSDGGRGRMFANGSAYVDGNAFAWGATASGSKFASNRRQAITADGDSSSSKSTEEKTVKENNVSVDTTVTTTEDSTSVETSANYSANVNESNFAQQNQNKSETDSGKGAENKFEETIDWIETILDRAERAIDKYEKQADNVYKTWAKRNKALEQEIVEVEKTTSLYEQAKNKYWSELSGVGLTEVNKDGISYATLIQNGSLNIQDFKDESDEKLVEKIKNYQDLYEKYLDCIDKIDELKEKEASLYAQRFENVQSEYENILQGFDHTESMLNEYIAQAEEQGYIVSKEYYKALTDNEEDRIAKLKQEQADLIAKRDEAVANPNFDRTSQEWHDMCAAIDDVTQAIEKGETAILSYAKAMREIEWETFDLIQERITDITKEADFLVELMSNEKLFDKNNKFTGQGLATAGLHAQNYNTYMYQADLAGEEAARLKQQLDSTPYDTNLENRYREMIELQREYILAAEDSKNAIVDLVREGIELEIEALDEKIQKYNDALDAQKDLYDYQKRVEEQTKEISSLQKQLSAYEGDNSEEAKAKIQELRVSLEKAEEDLQETEYEKFINDQSALLDNLFLEYETLLNERLDNTDDIVRQVVDAINGSTDSATVGSNNIISQLIGTEGNMTNALGGHAEAIKGALEKEATSVGVKLSDAMNNIWNAGEKPVLTMYGDSFQSKQTTTNSILNGIKSSVDSMVSSLNKQAAAKTTANKTSSSSVKNPTTTTTTNNQTNTNNKPSSNSKALTEDQLMGIAASIWVDGHASGWGNDPIRSGKLTEKFGLETAKKVQAIINAHSANGDLYRFWLNHGKNLKGYHYNAFKFGARKIDESQLAWTQEQGQEYIVRPSDGAILTPVAKGDSVLTSSASNNIWKMANSPAEFIKDNLNFGATNVPNNSNVQNSCVQNFDKVVFSMPNVHNYQEFLSEMQKDKNFERLVESMTIGKLAGKSSLAKGKAIR